VFDRVTLRASDLEASLRFYEAVLAVLGVEQTSRTAALAEWDDFSLAPASAATPVTRRLHIAWLAPSRGHVGAFWRTGTAAVYRDDGAPGERPEYGPDYYGAFLLDPDGNSAEAVHHGDVAGSGVIDHLWIRVADVEAAKAFYATIAAAAGFRLAGERPGWAHFAGAGGTFSLVPGEPTENLHMAFPAPDRAAVYAFHRTATGAGYRDNGGPGERAQYHPGYYGAFVLDPDGNNIEAVFHDER
jgi:catechol 2,3-dioxygenase-like lactoylglutathione lyase family enzyme